MNSFLDKFKRITTTGEYFATIDGLRFIAITLVVMFHISSSIPPGPKQTYSQFPMLTDLIRYGWQGVEIFFVISGFIIGLPFAKQYIHGGRKVELKSYFFRRVTRLEPPYIILVIIAFLFNFLFFHLDFESGIKSAAASMIYMNNLIYQDINKMMISVLWSLEIEVQFYILAVLITKIYKFNPFTRRSIFVFVILLMPYLQKFVWETKILTIFNYLQFFMIGILIADLWLDKKIKTKSWFTLPIGIISLLVMLYSYYSKSLENHYVYLVALFLFNFAALFDKTIGKILSIKWIATIGGMCYSIYLLHGLVIMSFSKLIKAGYIPIFDHYLKQFAFNAIILVPLVLFVSGAYFFFIEKPCMDRTWPQQLKEFFISKFELRKSEV